MNRFCHGMPLSKSGVTMLEALIAIMILSIGIAGASAVIVAGAKLGDAARDHYTAINIGKSRFERARTLAETSFGDLAFMAETGTPVSASGDEGVSSAQARFLRVTQVSTNITTTEPPLASTANMIEFVVTIVIKDRKTLVFSNQIEVVRTIFTKYY